MKKSALVGALASACSLTANFASWKVYVDGVLSSSSSLLVKDGQLVVKTPSGMLLVVH